jgi:hypothetical protein
MRQLERFRRAVQFVPHDDIWEHIKWDRQLPDVPEGLKWESFLK